MWQPEVPPTAEEIKAARDWVGDCSWLDYDYLDEYSDEQIVAGIQVHYDGGWRQFRIDNELEPRPIEPMPSTYRWFP